jgi:hypothetical protein
MPQNLTRKGSLSARIDGTILNGLGQEKRLDKNSQVRVPHITKTLRLSLRGSIANRHAAIGPYMQEAIPTTQDAKQKKEAVTVTVTSFDW